MIDWDRVAELRDEIGEEGFAEIAEIFIEEIDETLAHLAAAGTAPQASDFHFLRGSAVNLGFADFATLARAAEETCAAGRSVDIGRMRRTFDASVAEMQRRVRQAA